MGPKKDTIYSRGNWKPPDDRRQAWKERLWQRAARLASHQRGDRLVADLKRGDVRAGEVDNKLRGEGGGRV